MTDSTLKYPQPSGLNSAGQKLWKATVEDTEWEQHELAVLEEACRTRDRIVQLDAAVSGDGVMLMSSQGNRVHPAIAEARQQRLTLARLLVSLAIPPLEEDVLPKASAPRGVYALGGRKGGR